MNISLRTSAVWVTAALLGFTAMASASELHGPDGSQPAHRGGRTFVIERPQQVFVIGHQWPGTYFEGHFSGPAVTAKLEDTVNRFALYVDGKIVATQRDSATGSLTASGFSADEHSVRLEQLSENQGPATTFVGFFAAQPDHKTGHWPKRTRTIEFIGDSYTVGYGNTSPKRQCTQAEIHDTTDTSQAFGPIVAKHYDADYQINAISGHGIVRNYGGAPGDPVPVAYPYDTFDHAHVHSDQFWQPQIIVIGLGTNDFSTPLNAGEKWKTRDDLHADYEATYVKFVKNLRTQNPNAQFVLMATDQVEGEIQAEVKKVITRLNADGESRIVFLPMNGLEMTGCDWHPSTADDRKVSGILMAYIDAHPELWQGK